MILLREAIRSLVASPLVLLVGGAFVALSLLGVVEHTSQSGAIDSAIEGALSHFDQGSLAREIGAAEAYATGCKLEIDGRTLSAALAFLSVSPNDLLLGGKQRDNWEEGARSIARILAVDGGEGGNRDLTCSLGVAAYGSGGRLIPGLLRASA